jgi:hypothetical protein
MSTATKTAIQGRYVTVNGSDDSIGSYVSGMNRSHLAPGTYTGRRSFLDIVGAYTRSSTRPLASWTASIRSVTTRTGAFAQVA